MTPAVETTIQRLDEARGRWWLFSTLCSIVLVVLISLGLLLAFVFADAALTLSAPWRWAMLLIWSVGSAVVLADTVARVLKRQRSLAAAARRVEDSFPQLGSWLITLVQLAESNGGGPESFRRAALQEAVSAVRDTPFDRAAHRGSRWWRWRRGLQTPRDLAELSVALAALLAAAYALSVYIPTWSSSLERLFTPWRFTPQVGAVRILEVAPGDTQLLEGSRLEITARIAEMEGPRPKATLYVARGDEPEKARPIFFDAKQDAYAAAIPAVLQSLKYRLEIGDSQTRIYTVEARRKPIVDQFEVAYKFPAYLGLAAQVVKQKHGDLQAPQYTIAQLRLHCSSPLSTGCIELGGQRTVGAVSADKRTLTVSVPMIESTVYTIHLFDDAHLSDPNPRPNSIRVAPDRPPEVEIVKPSRDAAAAPGGQVSLVVRAGDDHGLGQVRLEWKTAQEAKGEGASGEGAAEGPPEEKPPQVERVWDKLAGTTAATLSHELAIPTDRVRPGQTLLVRAVAVDRREVSTPEGRLAPQETASSWRRIRVIDSEQQAAELLARRDSVRAKLWAIFKLQMQARILTGQLLRTGQLPSALQLASQVRRKQVQVQKDTAALASSISAEQDEEEIPWKQTLARLAHEEMLQAVEQSERAAQMRVVQEASEHGQPLIALQDRIIDVLRRLLDQARLASSDALAEMKDRPGGDLPDDTLEKLQGLDEKLREFLKQQRRVIEATENLAKKPVEDFSEEEEQLLKDLAAAEDEWARFLEETHSDFSKLPEQDFSNPSALEELVEIQTEIEMAEDALTKKTADIAVPLEQLGAEMAEELSANLEKWLPDTPDRQRWSQEEALSDEMKEAPMAELPGELEDLVGQLMEEEEDLFDEMEDVSSSAADSLDKGAGWDAADGPISNMSAKGVTGNRLPNTSEIGGRSGEGRQGKSSGEFVGDTAVGKGGRRTPSRLAPDPFVKGQVKDYSKDPTGGATGGGKESGAGGEGLEGPTPNRRQPELQRLAQKQADLRNRAEKTDVKFQVLNYHHTDLKKLIDVMKAVEADLKSGRYHSALRRREVMLQGLGNIKTYLDGEFQIRRDRTTNLPEDVEKELLSSMQDASPPGWEELNRKYFARLAGEEQETPPDKEDK